jgi:arylsulfatase
MSLVPALTADAPIERASMWWQHEGNRALRIGDYKIVAAGKDSPWELYDLSKDRSETHNLAEVQGERVASMAREWQRIADEQYARAKLDLPAQGQGK